MLKAEQRKSATECKTGVNDIKSSVPPAMLSHESKLVSAAPTVLSCMNINKDLH